MRLRNSASLRTDACFSKLFYATEGNRAGKRFPSSGPVFRLLSGQPKSRYPGIKHPITLTAD